MALELDPTFGESHGAMAAMYAMKGDFKTAERDIEMAERLYRNGMSSHFARTARRQVWRRRGNPQIYP